VPVKGGYREFLSHCVIITSNEPIEQWYKFRGYRVDALRRRIEHYYKCKNYTNCLLLLFGMNNDNLYTYVTIAYACSNAAQPLRNSFVLLFSFSLYVFEVS